MNHPSGHSHYRPDVGHNFMKVFGTVAIVAIVLLGVLMFVISNQKTRNNATYKENAHQEVR